MVHLLLHEDISLIIMFLEEYINDDDVIEHAINQIIMFDDDEEIFQQIEQEINITEIKEKIILKFSIQYKINFFHYSKNKNENSNIVDEIIDNDCNIKDIIQKIKNDDNFEYLVNNFLFKEKNIVEIKDIYDNLNERRKEIINKFFLKNTKNTISKFKINPLFKNIRNKSNIEYK
jgi:hypothetical protein